MKKNGFTLIELIVVVGIMAVLGLIFTNTLMQTLRGQNKVRILNQVKQNGQVAMEKISNAIRQGEKVVCIGNSKGLNVPTPNDTIITYKGTYSRIRFYQATETANGVIKQTDFTIADIPDGVSEKDLCGLPTDVGLPNNISTLTDNDLINGVSVRFDSVNAVLSPIFKVNSLVGYADTVTINFRVSQGIKAGLAYESNVETNGVPFATTIQVRGGK